MTQRGFSLIELVIATAISAFLVIALYQVIDQMRRNTSRIESTAVFVDTVIRLEDEFQGTFGGMMIPNIPLSTVSTNTVTDTKTTPTAASSQKEEKKSDEQIPPFFAELSDGRLVRCSCVTTNSLAIYGKASALPVRVVYRVEPMTDTPDRYKLMRQELRDYTARDAEEQKAAVSYELLDMITTISLRVVVSDPEKSEKKPVFVEQRPWNSADQKHADILPEAVIVDCSWIHDGREYSHTIYSGVHAAAWYRERAADAKKTEEKKSIKTQQSAQSLPQGATQGGAA